MSVTLISPPPAFAFSADQIVAKFASSNYLQAVGSKAENGLIFPVLPVPAGNAITFKYGSTTVIMTSANAPDISGLQFLSTTSDLNVLLIYFQLNYTLSNDFDIFIAPYNAEYGVIPPVVDAIYFIAKKKALGFDMALNSGSYHQVKNYTAGSITKEQPNYRIYFNLYLENIDHTAFNSIYSSAQPLTFASNTAAVPIGDKLHTEIMKDLRANYPDIPDQGVLLCKKSCRRYYFEYAESYGDVPQVMKLHRSTVYTILHGGLSYIAQFNKTLQSLIAPGLPVNDRFLKQGSNDIYTRTNQPQYLYFFNTRAAAAGVKLKGKFYFTDETSVLKNIYTQDFESLRKYAFNVAFDQLVSATDYPDKTISKYEIWLESSAGEKISETRTYNLNYQYRQFVRYFLSWSSFGTMDTRICYGKGNSEFELFQKEANKILQLGYDVKQGSSIAYNLKIKSSYKVATGWLSKREVLLNRDFFLSAFKYRYVSGLMLPIRIDSKTIPELEDGNNLYSQLFDYSYQFDDHAYTEGNEEDPGVSSGDFFFNYGAVGNPTQGFSETDPTVPSWVKSIKMSDIEKWNAGGVSPDLSSFYTKYELNNFFGGLTAVTGYNKANWDNAFGQIGLKANYDDVYSKSISDGRFPSITGYNKVNWDTAFTNNHTHTNKTFLDSIIANATLQLNITGNASQWGGNTFTNGEYAGGLLYLAGYDPNTQSFRPSNVGSVKQFLNIGDRYNWVNVGAKNVVIGQLSWNNYGNGHSIFDASGQLTPDGVGVNRDNAINPWESSFPTLMGWNGVNTYGVRVDSSRVTDSIRTAAPVVKKAGDIWLA